MTPFIIFLDNIFIRCIYKMLVFFMDTNCVLLLHICFVFYERDFMLSLSGMNQVDVIEAFKKASKYDQEISQSHTADQPTAPCGRAT